MYCAVLQALRVTAEDLIISRLAVQEPYQLKQLQHG